MNTQTFTSNKRAFTVVEILVASGIMAAVTAMVLWISVGVLSTWNNASEQLSTNSRARAVLDLVVQDLEAAIFRNNGDIWMYAATLPTTPDGIDPGHFLCFFTTAVDRPKEDYSGNAIPGDVTAVAYMIDKKNPLRAASESTRETYNFYRSVVNGRDTFNAYLGQLATGPNGETPAIRKGRPEAFFHEAQTVFNQTGEAIAPVSFDEAFMAQHILSFEIDFYVNRANADEDDEPLEWYKSNTAYTFPSADGLYLSPTYADVSLVVLSEEGAELLDLIEEGQVTLNAADVIREHSTEFSRRIYFMNKPL